MNERIVPAKNGYTVELGTTALHSRYDPVLEAEKYIASLNLKPCKFFILIEPGLGYLAKALRKTFPLSKIISLHCSLFFRKHDPAIFDKEPGWDPGVAYNLEDFLEDSLNDAEASEIKLIDWKPSVNAYGRACLDLASRTVECIRRISAGRKTVRNFGRRWLRNALRNLELPQAAEAMPGSVPALVCAAGPSLEDSLADIQKWKQSPSPPLVIAVSSAAPALLHWEIKPDIIIATDGGPWALFHLIESFRQYGRASFPETNDKPVLAAALTAALPSQTAQWPVFFLWDGSLWQKLLLEAAGRFRQETPPGTKGWSPSGPNVLQENRFLPFPAFPQRGTVSASALDLAFFLSAGNVYISGLDLTHRDIITHARPYAFETLMECSADRCQPLYSRFFEREEIIRSSGSLDIYKTWFSTCLDSFPRRFFTLASAGLAIPLKKPAINEDGKFPRFTTKKTKPGINRKQGIKTLLDALTNPLTAEQLCKELGELILPFSPMINKHYSDTVKEALMELS